MANITISVDQFMCESPKIGNVYRKTTTTGEYVFNYMTKGDIYQSYGLNTKIKIFILPEQSPPEQEYTSSALPFSATDYSIGTLPYDTASFRFEFSIDDGTTCYYSIDIPYQSIIIT